MALLWSRPSRAALGLAITLGSAHPAVARAADVPVAQAIEAGEQALGNLDYEAANQAATRALAERALTHDQLVRAYRLLAITSAVLDRDGAARDAFQQLLTFDPSYEGDPNLGPKVESPFLEARGFMRAQAVEPGVEVSVTVRPNEPGTIRVTTRDPTHLARRVTVGFRWGTEGDFTRGTLPVSDAVSTAVPAPPVGTARLDYFVQVLDDREDAIFETGTPTSPKSATVEAPIPNPAHAPPDERHPTVFASPIFWTIAGVVLAGVGTGVYFAAKKPGDATSATLSPSFRCWNGSTLGHC